LTTCPSSLGEYLQELMAGRTQSDWAAELGVAQSMVSYWWRGERVGRRSLAVLLARFPEHRDELMRLTLGRVA
jgi:predicted transcriptional regulator